MGYCALLIPQTKQSKPKSNAGIVESVTGKLMSGLDGGGLSFDNATTVLKNAAGLVSENMDTIASKFSGIALTQLLVDGNITSDTAFDYFTQAFPQALGLTSVSEGFQSVEQLKTALKSKNGVNVQQFISSFQNFGTALSNVGNQDKVRRNVEGYQIIEIDLVDNDSRDYSSETPDRRVESGQTFQEFIHNMPEMFTLSCALQEGKNYTADDFEEILINIRASKIAINIILGDTIKKSYVLTHFTPIRTSISGLQYNLEFKHIGVGSVQLVPLSGSVASAIKGITPNALNPDDTKTGSIKSLGMVKPKPYTENFKEKYGDFLF